MPILLLLSIVIVVAFATRVAYRYGHAERPGDVSVGRWVWLTVIETAAEWRTYVRDTLRGLPGYFRAWRHQRYGSAPATAAPAAPRRPDPPAAPSSRPAPPPLPAATVTAGAPVLTGTVIPPDHAAVHARIAGFEPDDDAALLDFYRGEASAFGGYAAAWEAHADMLLHGVGLDPAFTQVAAELAGEVGDLAHSYALVMQRFHVVYASVQQFVAGGGTLPYEARSFLTGEGA